MMPMDSTGVCPPPAAPSSASSSSSASARTATSFSAHDRHQQPQHHDRNHANTNHNHHTSSHQCCSVASHPHHHHSSHHHHEEAEMFESDGDILELGIAQPGTPVLSPLRPPPSSPSSSSVGRRGSGGGGGTKDALDAAETERLPLLPEAAIAVVSHPPQLSVGMSDVSSASAPGGASGRGGGGGPGRPDPPPPLPTRPAEILRLPGYRRCLSGDDAPISTVGSAAELPRRSSSSSSRHAAVAATATAGADADAAGGGAASIDAASALGGSSGAAAAVPSPKSVANGASSVDPTLVAAAAAAASASSALPPPGDSRGTGAEPTMAASGKAPPPILSAAAMVAAAPPSSPLPTARSCRENPAEAIHGPSIVSTSVSSISNSGSGGGSNSTHPLSLPHRSKSIDRRLHEAAQFAEAVGEVPPTNESEALKFIIEEDCGGSSSDDSDDEGVAETEAELAREREEQEQEQEEEKKRREGAAGNDLGAANGDDDVRVPVDLNEYERGGSKSDYASRSSLGFDDERQRDERDVSVASDSVALDTSMQSAGLSERGTPPPPLSEATTDRGVGSPTKDRSTTSSQRREEERAASIIGQGIRRRLIQTKPAPSSTSGAGSRHHLNLLRTNSSAGPNGFASPSQAYVYKGIHSNPPEITKRGISRGNYAQLHRKAWLEVSDKYHRYGKNLRLYYKHWESLGHPTNMFFDWLDSKGEAAGQPLPNLPECPRSELDSDTVLYVMNPEVQERYLLSIVRADGVGGSPEDEETDDGGSSCEDGGSSGGEAILVDADGVPVRTGPDGWIFVLRDHALYGGQKVTSIAGKSKQRFHHSSFFGGKAVAAAGILITNDSGRLLRLYPHSGHYRPTEAHMQRMLYFLQQSGFDLTTFGVDTQQILHVSRTLHRATPKGGVADDKAASKENDTTTARDKNANTAAAAVDAAAAPKKCKKVHSLHLRPALYVACLLAHKARMIGQGAFSQIHKIRTEGATSVREALDAVDGGGYWKNIRSAME